MSARVKMIAFGVLALVGILATALVLEGSIGGIILMVLLGGFFALGVRRVPEEERWNIEVFGAYYRKMKPGFRWLFPWVEKVRAKVAVWTQKYPLFVKPIKIDTRDGSAAIPKEAFAYVKANEEEDEGAVYKMTYEVEDLQPSAVALLENAVRSFLNSCTIDQALVEGRGGYNIAGKLPAEDLNGVKEQLKEWGLWLVRITIGDLDLDEETLRARRVVIQTQKAREAAVHKAEQRLTQTVGVKVKMLMKICGLADEAAVAAFLQKPENKELREEVLGDCQAIWEDLVAGEEGTLFRGRGGAAENLLFLLGKALGGRFRKEGDGEVTEKPPGKKPEDMTREELYEWAKKKKGDKGD